MYRWRFNWGNFGTSCRDFGYHPTNASCSYKDKQWGCSVQLVPLRRGHKGCSMLTKTFIYRTYIYRDKWWISGCAWEFPHCFWPNVKTKINLNKCHVEMEWEKLFTIRYLPFSHQILHTRQHIRHAFFRLKTSVTW